jgi:hypothetical protein
VRAAYIFLGISSLLAGSGWTTTCHAATPPGNASPTCPDPTVPCSTPAPYRFLGLDLLYTYFNVGGGPVWLKPDVAADRGTASSGAVMAFSVGFGLLDLVAGEAGGEVLSLDDHAKFDEDVVVVSGPVGSVGHSAQWESEIFATHATVAAGLRTPSLCLWPTVPGRDNCVAAHAYFFLGQSWTSGTRSIGKCEGCREEDLHFVGGSFIEPGLTFGLPSRSEGVGIGVRTSFRHYQRQATLANEVRFALDLLFF